MPPVDANTSLNGTAGATTPHSSASPHAAGGKAQLKMTTNPKTLDGSRRQTGSPMDGTARKPPVQKAWTQGTNPITQRPNNPSNGVSSTSRAPGSSQNMSAPKETQTPDRHANDRLMYLFGNFVGLPCSATLKNGEQYTGIFSSATFDSESKYVFKMAKKLHSTAGSQVNGVGGTSDDYVGAGEDHVMVFDRTDVVLLTCQNVYTNNKAGKQQNGVSAFRTDADISGGQSFRERNLQRWEDTGDSSLDLSLGAPGKTWDQFEANKRLYGVTSSYDESFYTTTIDKSDPQYKQRAAQAEKIAREIESSNAMNAHVAEERGLTVPDDSGADEEAKYSGVRRDFPPLPSGNLNKYTPPARRAPTGQPTVAGAPVDPAIISAQIARPGVAISKSTLPNQGGESGANTARATAKSPEAQPSAPTPTPSAKVDATKEATASSSSQKPVDSKSPVAAGKGSANAPVTSPNRAAAGGGNATATVAIDVLGQFKSFANVEKLKAVEKQRASRAQDKAVKLNDLKKFSENFKLKTAVPSDLVPILAKDKGTQQKIVEKAMRNVQETQTQKPEKPTTGTIPVPEPKSLKASAPHPAGVPSYDRTNQQRNRQNHANFSQSVRGDRPSQQQIPQIPPRSGPGGLGQRLTYNQHNRAGLAHINPNLPMPGMQSPASGQSSELQSPTKALSAKALEFRPNPAANTFLPTKDSSNSSSPRQEPSSRPATRPVSTAKFFDIKKPLPPSERPSIEDDFNPIERMKKEAEADNRGKDLAANGGIPAPYRTPPVWDVPEANREKTYVDMFDKPQAHVQGVPPAHSGPAPIPIPHQHQLPPHLQGPQPVGQVHTTPHQTPRHMPVQPHHGHGGHHEFDHHRMQYSTSSSAQPSPRPNQPYLYNGGHGPQPVQVYPQGIPYAVAPGGHPMTMRQVSAGSPYVTPQGPVMGGHMMANQPSSGPFMNPQMGPQVQMYSPAPGHVYPQHNGPPMAVPGPNGFPSPNVRHAPMMSHQGSQQGHPQQQLAYVQHGGHGGPMFIQAPGMQMAPMRGPFPQPHQPQHFGTSPHQPQHFPMQHRGTPSANYAQPMMATHSMPGPQGHPPPGPGPMGNETGEEVK